MAREKTIPSPGPSTPPAWVRTVNRISKQLSQDLFGGPRLVKMAFMVNLHKFLSAFVVALLMLLYHNYSPAAWAYLALHGTYGFCWVMKHSAFRDARWETKVTTGGATMIFLILATYWIAPFLLISRSPGLGSGEPSYWFISICIAIYAMGLAIMIASDAQKHFTLKVRKGLIKEGMFQRVRHPNYLGEMMIYGSFALLARHWIPWLVLAFWWTAVFLPNMLTIESSLSRYPEWQAYRAATGMLLPRILKRTPKS